MFTEIFADFAEQFSEAGPFIFRLIIAAACGAVIGFERMIRQKEAGLRTHIIVALGSALIILVSKYGFLDIVYLNSVQVDASRLASNVVTGVSFLGSGIIIFKGSIKGLTTAAGVWTTAGIGLAIGAGQYVLGISATVILLLIQVLIHRFLPIENTATGSLTMKLKDEPDALNIIHEKLKENGCDVTNCNLEKKDGLLYCSFNMRMKKTITFENAQEIFSECPFVISVTI